MSTRWKVEPFKSQGGLQTGLEGIDIPEDFELPSCGIEDVDRALFKLFNDDLPLYYDTDGDQTRVPCIFAGGERAMILRRKQPLRDRSGALILPLVSILRSGIDQSAEKAIGPGTGSIILKRKVSKDDRLYKKQKNQEGLTNQDNIAPTIYQGANSSLHTSNDNIYEIITIPNPRFFTATYEVTFWAQYVQQMNNLIEALVTSYNNGTNRSFRIDTDKGYWFSAVVEPGLNESNNFDGYADDERLIKTSITVKVVGYIINPTYSGAPNPFRRYVSSPKVQFETVLEDRKIVQTSKIPSGDPDHYTHEDLASRDYPLPGATVGHTDQDGPEYSVNIGGAVRDNENNKLKGIKISQPTISVQDPFEGTPATAVVKSKNPSKGETVYRIIETLKQDRHN